MNRFFELIDKYKFGLIAVVAGYVFIFSYLQMESYTKYTPISSFQDGPEIIPEEEIILDPGQIEVPPNYSGDVKNMVRDRNDKREKSWEDYSQNKSSKSIEQQVKNYEAKLFEESGGKADREKMIQEYKDKLQRDADQKKKDAAKNKGDANSNGGAKQFAGSVMVDWELSNRNAHQNNNWNVRNPGYTCGKGSGLVVIIISVNQGGNVVSQKYDASSSTGATECMITQAMKYAGMSRFDYSGTAPRTQEGKIYYTFVSQ